MSFLPRKSPKTHKFDRAIDCLMQSQAIFEELGNKMQVAGILSNMDFIHKNRGDLKQAIGYRLSLGFGRIILCLWNISELHVYNTDGELNKVIDLDGKLKDPVSAAFVSSETLAVAANEGLFIVDLDTAVVVQTVNKDTHADVFYHGNSLYALNRVPSFSCSILALVTALTVASFVVEPFKIT